MKYTIRILQVALFLLVGLTGYTQNNVHRNCSNALQVYNNTSLSYWNNSFDVQDLNNTNNGCLGAFEHESIWIKFTIRSGTTLDFDIVPDNADDDYDFAVYGPNADCGSLPTPIRCNYNGSRGTTGLSTPNGARYDTSLPVSECETYYLVIDNHPNGSQIGGFTLNWGGDVVVGECCKETYVECIELDCGESFDPFQLPFPNPCGGTLIAIDDIIEQISYEPTNPVQLSESTVLRLVYDCCEVYITVKIKKDPVIIYRNICLAPGELLRLEPCDPFSPPIQYTVNGVVITSNDPFMEVDYVPNGEYSVTSTSEEGCPCTVIYTVITPAVSTVYGSWCAGVGQFDLSTIIDPDCLSDIDNYTVTNNLTGQHYGSLILSDPDGGYSIFGNGGGGDLLCLTFRSTQGDCEKCIVRITLRFYDGDCNNEPEPIYCDEIHGPEGQSSTPSGTEFKAQRETINNKDVMITASPNPAVQVINFRYTMSKRLDNTHLIITDLSGKKIEQFSIEKSSGLFQMDINHLSDGMYFYSLIQNEKILASDKIIIQK